MNNKYGLLLSNLTENKEVAEAVADAEQEINAVFAYVQSKLPDVISFGVRVVLCFVLFLLGRMLVKCFRKLVRRSMEHANADKGVIQFTDSLLKFGLYALMLFFIATWLGVEASSIAALLASCGVAVGLALQGSLSNLAGGILILILKPFVVGDYIIEDSGKNEGTVKEIQIFYTKLSTADNKIIIVPNGTLANNTITNVTARPERQLEIRVGISYDADIRKAKDLLLQAALANPAVIQEEEYGVFVDDLADSSVILLLRAWVHTSVYRKTRWQLLEEIKYTFDEHGIEIPYNQLTVHMDKE